VRGGNDPPPADSVVRGWLTSPFGRQSNELSKKVTPGGWGPRVL
jgi:hypothetical protein